MCGKQRWVMKKIGKIFLYIILTAIFAACFVACASTHMPTEQNGKVLLTSDAVSLHYVSPVYTGSPIELGSEAIDIRLNGRAQELSGFDIEYSDNVNAGTAYIVITAKESNASLYGSVRIPFTILPATADVYVAQDAATFLADDNYSTVTLNGVMSIGAEIALNVPEGKILNIGIGSAIDFKGTLDINGKLQLLSGATLVNSGSITNNGEINISGNAEFYTSSPATGTGTFSNRGTLYCNDAQHGYPGNVVIRVPLSDATVELQNERIEYQKGVTGYTPGKVTIRRPDGYTRDVNDFSPVFSSNDYIGIAYLTLTAAPGDANFYGSISVPYEIVPGKATVQDLEALRAALGDPDYAEIYIDGNISVPEGETLIIPEGYALTLYSGSLRSQGSVIVNGTVSSSSAKLVANDIEINGSMFVDGALVVEGRFVNNGFVKFTNNSGLSPGLSVSSLVNNGTIINTGNVYYKSETPFVAGEFDNVNGNVYSYCQIDGLLNVTVKYDVADEEVFFLANDTAYYNATEQKPGLRFAHGSLSMSYCYVYYYRDGKPTTDFTQPGTIEVRLSVRSDTPNAYRGSASRYYTINRGTTTVSNYSSLSRALKDVNYEKVQLDTNYNDSTTSVKMITVSENVTLDTGGAYATFLSVKNYGTIVNGASAMQEDLPSDGDNCLICSEFDNYGTFVNNGIFATSSSENSYFVSHNGATFENNGYAYLNARDDATSVEGDGFVSLRRYLTEFDFTPEYTQTYYDASAKTPVVNVSEKSDGSEVVTDRLYFDYRSNVNAGTARILVAVQDPGVFAPYSGIVEITFEILRSSVQVTSAQALLSAAADGNYCLIELESNVYLGDASLTLQPDVILDCSSYELTLSDGNYPVVPDNSSIKAVVSDIGLFKSYIKFATDVSLVSNIGDNSETLIFDSSENKVNLVVDLNGFDLKAAVQLSPGKNSFDLKITDTSSERTGTVSGIVTNGERSGYAVTTSGHGDYSVKVVLENITVYGLKPVSGSGKKCELTATDCTFYAGGGAYAIYMHDSANIGLSAVFNNCNVTAEQAVYMSGWETKIEFNGCNITATGRYSAPSAYSSPGTGFAVAVYFLHPTQPIFNNCTIVSQNGYALVQTQPNSASSYPPQTFCIHVNGGTLSGAVGQYYVFTDTAISSQ